MAYPDQPQAAMMPSDTSVSIEAVPCWALLSAVRWNGQTHHRATGAVQAASSHCQPPNRSDGTSDSISDRSVSGMKKASETYSRRRRYAKSWPASRLPSPSSSWLACAPRAAAVYQPARPPR